MVIPTLTSARAREGLVEAVRATGRDVLIVDDASPDGTGQLADELAAADAHVLVLHRERKRGLGDAVMHGFREGLSLGYDLLFEIDADGSHAAADLERLAEAAELNGGMALGSRFVTGGIARHRRWRRSWLSWIANMLCRICLGVQPVDWTSGYRCYPREVLEGIGPGRIRSVRYGFQIELVFWCRKLGYPVTEVPIQFRDRAVGRSKLSAVDMFAALVTLVGLIPARWSPRPDRAVRRIDDWGTPAR